MIRINLGRNQAQHSNGHGIANLDWNRASEYQKVSQSDHVRLRPDMYVGSVSRHNSREIKIFDLTTETFIYKNVDIPMALDNIYREVLSNAGDNIERSKQKGVISDLFEVEMNKTTVTITNGGLSIPIVKHPTEKIYVPEMIFGHFLTSSNYDDSKQRTVVGRNGVGVKAVSSFSKRFSVQIGDPTNKKMYIQTWTNYMKNRSDPQITSYSGPSFVRVSYDLDLNYFGYQEYSQDVFGLYASLAADISFCNKIKVKFNDKILDMTKMDVYVKKCFPDIKLRNKIIHREEIPLKSQIVELTLLDTPDNGRVIGFVNGSPCHAGVHVDAAIKTISDVILPKLNNNNEKNSPKLNIKNIRPHLSMIISVKIVNPRFTNQAKSKLDSPKIKITIPENKIKNVSRWKLITRLKQILSNKYKKKMKESDGKKKKFISAKNYTPANFAGGGKSQECVLILTEGLSAKPYAETWISQMGTRGRDYYGIFPLKGKPLNVINAPQERISKNDEIATLKKILGLREDTDYKIPRNFSQLNYGKVMIFADADVDGIHIVSLILLLFYKFYGSLLERGFLQFYRTPILRATKGSQKMSFLSEQQYRRWLAQDSSRSNWRCDYFKGLGSSSEQDTIDDFNNPHVVNCIFDPGAKNWFELAFNKTKSNERKVWIEQAQPMNGMETVKNLPISNYIARELVTYSLVNIVRSIPGIDGLKRSQRKIIYGSMLIWKGKCGQKATKMKTARLASAISTKTDYHHGEKSLQDAITSMVQCFVGANNMPYFMPDGKFGTRGMLGKNASSARYTFTRPQWWWPYIYSKEDVAIYKYVEEEGDQLEPRLLFPLIPMVLVNGATGIGTGHSTFIPQHNPVDICQWIILKLTGKDPPGIKPWYNGFNGKIEVKYSLKDASVTKMENYDHDILSAIDESVQYLGEERLFEENSINTTLKPAVTKGLTMKRMTTYGNFTISGDDIEVSELPIMVPIDGYYEWLNKLLEMEKIRDRLNHTVDDIPNFKIKGFKLAQKIVSPKPSRHSSRETTPVTSPVTTPLATAPGFIKPKISLKIRKATQRS